MNKTNTLVPTSKIILGAAGLIMAITFISLPLFASAGTYAFVDATGEVKPVVADTWQQAIAAAVNIHKNSGVMLLDSPSDFDIVGNKSSTY